VSERRHLLDTDVLRFAITRPAFQEHLIREFRLWSLSAVVVHELIRAARTALARAAVEALIRRVPRRVEPGWADWQQAAAYLRHLGEESGFDPASVPARQNDALIASSAWRLGMSVVTCNGGDFNRLARFMRRRAGDLIVLEVPLPGAGGG
jgi:predicted nucleic acid-binding protein